MGRASDAYNYRSYIDIDIVIVIDIVVSGGGVKDHNRRPLCAVQKPLTACLDPGRDVFFRGSRFLKQYVD